MIDFESVTPLYEQVMNDIKRDIVDGKYESKKRLPTEDQFSEKYGVSRITIRRAINELCSQGIIVKKQGKGTFVCGHKFQKNFSTSGMSFTESCQLNGMKASAKTLAAEIIQPTDSRILQYLGLKKGDSAVFLERLRLADDKPVVIERNYFPLEYSFLLNVEFDHDSLYRYLSSDKGVNIVAGPLLLRIVRAGGKEAKLLDLPRNAPVLESIGCAYRDDGRVLHTINNIGYGGNFDFIVR